MKIAAKFLTAAIIILLTTSAEATDLTVDAKVFVEHRSITPRQHSRFVPPINIPHRGYDFPRREYYPRVPSRPVPRYTPSKPKPSYDNRGGKRKNFGPPQSTRR